jgi:hypothetical protein
MVKFLIPIISGTKQDKNPDFIPLKLPCIELNRPSPDFYIPFPDYDPKTTSGKKGVFLGPVEWEITC